MNKDQHKKHELIIMIELYTTLIQTRLGIYGNCMQNRSIYLSQWHTSSYHLEYKLSIIQLSEL